MASDVESWLRDCCSRYRFDVQGIFRRQGTTTWPLSVNSPEELEQALVAGDHILPLPKEPAALANVLEVSIVDFVLQEIEGLAGADAQRGSERGYPDLELAGDAFGGGHHAIDIKVAKRAVGKRGKPTGKTQSRITLYTGNTFFRYPQLKWAGASRPFNEYRGHLDILGIYTLLEDEPRRVGDLELIVQQPWKIASTRRSSTTREYIGAVERIDDLRAGRGEFETPEAFYRYWRKFPFTIGRATQAQLDKLLAEQNP